MNRKLIVDCISRLIYVLFRNDKKMDRLLTGISDGCDNCLTPRKLWTDVDCVEEGFPKNRTFENLLETWRSLAKDKNGQVIKRTGDYEIRQGLCHAPVTLRETWSFTMTHKVSIDKIVFKYSFLPWLCG